MTTSNKPKVSTITPCYKMKRYLKLFLDELPNQTYFDNLEIVLDHNNPDEEEISWVKDFQTKYPNKIKHIITSPVVPIGNSMNTCIRESSGELLTIWNVDDLRTSDSIEQLVDSIIENGSDISYGDYKIVREFAPVSEQSGGKLVEHKNIPESEFTRSMIFGPFFMFKKSLCAKVGLFDEQLVSGADFDFCIRLATHGKATMAKGILGYYLNEGKGASTRPGSKQELERTVIELRYGIYDKINYDHVAEACTYNLRQIVNDGVDKRIDIFVPRYQEMINERLQLWKAKGLSKYSIDNVLKISRIKKILKNKIRSFIKM